jgi:hypothetical protein
LQALRNSALTNSNPRQAQKMSFEKKKAAVQLQASFSAIMKPRQSSESNSQITLWLAVLAQCCTGLASVRRHSDGTAVGRDEERGSLAGEHHHRVAHVRTRSIARYARHTPIRRRAMRGGVSGGRARLKPS